MEKGDAKTHFILPCMVAHQDTIKSGGIHVKTVSLPPAEIFPNELMSAKTEGNCVPIFSQAYVNAQILQGNIISIDK